MKSNAISNIYSCFDGDGKLKNKKMFGAEVHKLISDGDFNAVFDFIMNTKTAPEVLQFITGIVALGLKRDSVEIAYILARLTQAQDQWLKNSAPIVIFELTSK